MRPRALARGLETGGHPGTVTRRRSRSVVVTKAGEGHGEYKACERLGPGIGAQLRGPGQEQALRTEVRESGSSWLHGEGPGSCPTQTGWGEGGPWAEASTSFPSPAGCPVFTEVASARTRILVPTSKLNFPWPHPLG